MLNKRERARVAVYGRDRVDTARCEKSVFRCERRVVGRVVWAHLRAAARSLWCAEDCVTRSQSRRESCRWRILQLGRELATDSAVDPQHDYSPASWNCSSRPRPQPLVLLPQLLVFLPRVLYLCAVPHSLSLAPHTSRTWRASVCYSGRGCTANRVRVFSSFVSSVSVSFGALRN